jgi:futalosine hydrolase
MCELGFPALEGTGERVGTDAAWREALRPLADRVGSVATVSTCSGTDAAAAEIRRRTGSLCEDMESGAAGLVAHRLGVPFACVRAISNRTGNRAEQGWDLALAFSALERVAASL